MTPFPKLNVLTIKEISPKFPIDVVKRQIDFVKRKELVDKTLKWKHDKERITHWTNIAFQELEENGTLVFAPLFFRIIATDQLFIAVKTAHNVLRKTTRNKQKYKIEIKPELVNYSEKKGIALWQMKIQNI